LYSFDDFGVDMVAKYQKIGKNVFYITKMTAGLGQNIHDNCFS